MLWPQLSIQSIILFWSQLGIQSTIILAVIFGAYRFLKKFLVKYIDSAINKYAEKKGENQATKEDIGIITKISEEIKQELNTRTEKLKFEFNTQTEKLKSELNSQTEKMKAELSLVNQHTLSWKLAERDALVQLHQKLIEHYLHLTGFTNNSFAFRTYGDFARIIENTNSGVAAFKTAYWRLRLFVNDHQIEQEVERILEITSNYYVQLADFINTVYNTQVQILPGGLNLEQPNFTPEENHMMDLTRAGFANFVNTTTTPLTNEIKHYMGILSIRIKERIAVIQS